ncbi:hypothetical protein ACIQ6Y_31190 [Streptomyces sp. NPDC096205]|uniref:hypothetical protein n=1 Tax=Streptomyces sp. NPDC096205 TaxID=3366081 RepID=UPI00382959EB
MEHHVTQFDFQQGWIDLTLEYGSSETEARELAESVIPRFNPLERTVGDRDLLNDLVDRALFLNKDEPLLAAAYYTPAGVPLADLWVDSYAEENGPRPAPAEVVPLLLDWSNAKVEGEPSVTYPHLAAGTSVRVQAMLKAKRLLGFGSQLAELVRYAVFPPDMPSVVVITATWQNMSRSDELTALTHELVSTLRLVPVDAQGVEADPAD